jgi:hypothetical protein
MSEIRASEALLPHAEELLAPLPLPEQIAAAALFLMPAPRVDQAAPFRVLLAGVAQYTDEAGDIAAAAQEKGAPTVVAGRDSYSMGGAYVTVLADGVLFFAHSSEALGQLLEAHLEGQMAPRELMNLCERVDGNALRMGVVWDENLRRLGPSLPFRASSDDVRQLALGVEGGEAVAFDGYVVLNNRTTAGKFAASLQAALPHMSVRGDEDVVRVAGMHAPGPAVGQVLRVTHQLLAPEPVIYDEATESETPAPEPDTQVESFE